MGHPVSLLWYSVTQYDVDIKTGLRQGNIGRRLIFGLLCLLIQSLLLSFCNYFYYSYNFYNFYCIHCFCYFYHSYYFQPYITS